MDWEEGAGGVEDWALTDVLARGAMHASAHNVRRMGGCIEGFLKRGADMRRHMVRGAGRVRRSAQPFSPRQAVSAALLE